MEAHRDAMNPSVSSATWGSVPGPSPSTGPTASPTSVRPTDAEPGASREALVSRFAKQLFADLYLPVSDFVKASTGEKDYLTTVAPILARSTMVGPDHKAATEFLPKWLRPTTNMTLADLVTRVSKLISGGHIDPAGEDGEGPPLALGFRKAIANADWGVVTEISKLGPELTRYDKYGLHPVHHLVLSGNFESVGVLEKLQEAGADLSARTETETEAHDRLGLGGWHDIPENEHPSAKMFQHKGFTALHLAVIQHNPVFVRELVRLGCNIDVKDAEGRTPLFHAFSLAKHEPEYAEIIDILVNAEADLNTSDKQGKTLWHVVVETANLDGADRLVSARIPPTGKAKFHRYKGGISDATPLHTAILARKENMVNRLIGAGANLDATFQMKLKTDYTLWRWHKEITPLHAAALMGAPEIVETLLRRGASVDSRDSIQYTPLMLATVCKVEDASGHGFQDVSTTPPSHRDVIRRLRERGADVNAVSAEGHTALHWATRYSSAETTELLLELDATPSAGDQRRNPLSDVLPWRNEYQWNVREHTRSGRFESGSDYIREQARSADRKAKRWSAIVDKMRQARGGKGLGDYLEDWSSSLGLQTRHY